jgi:hypothetical protein
MAQDDPSRSTGIEWIAARQRDGLAVEDLEIVGAIAIFLFVGAGLFLVIRYLRRRSAVSACAWRSDQCNPGAISRWTCENCGAEGFGRERNPPSNCARHSRPKAL